jgi:addiction module RelE/StbE family toxin
MKIVFDARAVDDLTHIHSRIVADNSSTAAGVLDSILAGIERLGLYPAIGRAGKVEGTREWVVPRLPYIVVYQLDEAADVLRVIAVFHGAQDR